MDPTWFWFIGFFATLAIIGILGMVWGDMG
jgi:hypothetical protein